VHQRERCPVGEPQPLHRQHGRADGQQQGRGQLFVGRELGHREHRGGRLTASGQQVVVEAGQCDRPEDARGYHHRAQTTSADNETLIHQPLDRLPDRGPGHPELLGEVKLVVEPLSRFQGPVADRMLEILRDLEVQRNRAVAVEWPLQVHAKSITEGLSSVNIVLSSLHDVDMTFD
jgi:hypothetical protein